MKHWKALFTLFSIVVLAGTACAEPVLTAPNTAPAGSDIEIGVSGLESEKDFITIVESTEKEGVYKKYQYPKKKDSVTLMVPERAGDYEIRLLDGDQRYATLASLPLTSTPVEASLSGPEEIAAGSEIEMRFTGPENKSDFLTIVEKGAREGSYEKYQYVKRFKGSGVAALTAPELAGEYEVRYLTGKEYFTLAAHPLTVTAVEASLKAPESAVAGATIAIDWEGPDNSQDFITIVEADAKEGSYEDYQYVRRKFGPRELNRVEMEAPEKPGSYEVRYLSGKKRLTLAAVPFQVTAADASLTAEGEVMEGATFEVEWSGPDNKGDYITLVPKGEKEGKTGSTYAYVKRKQGPRDLQIVQLEAPERSGEYELRYVTGDKRFTLASQPLTIVPASASIAAPEEAPARDVVEVSWEGPGNNGDYIALVKPDSADDGMRNFAYVRRGKVLRIKTPLEPGAYELRYLTGQKQKVLASEAIQITPSKVPGKLKVVAEGEISQRLLGGDQAVALVLDASGSMLKQEKGVRRIELAKKAVTGLLEGPLSNGTPFAMRVFGHKEADSCRTDLEIPLAPLNTAAAKGTVQSIEAKNYAKTPIAKSLELVKSDLESAEGSRVVILVTDGEETCDGDPAEAIKALAAAGFDTRVNIVGFAIGEEMLKETFREWARLGNGKYFDAENGEQLEKSILEATRVPYEVLNAEQEIVATGIVNGETTEILPGNYTVQLLTKPKTMLPEVTVEPEKVETVVVSRLTAG